MIPIPFLLTGCGGRFSALDSDQVITSPPRLVQRKGGVRCSWIFQVSDTSSRVAVALENVELGANCTLDSLRVNSSSVCGTLSTPRVFVSPAGHRAIEVTYISEATSSSVRQSVPPRFQIRYARKSASFQDQAACHSLSCRLSCLSGCGGSLIAPGFGTSRRLRPSLHAATSCLWRIGASNSGARVVAKLKSLKLGPAANCPSAHFVRLNSFKFCNVIDANRSVVADNSELQVEFRLPYGSLAEVEYSGESKAALSLRNICPLRVTWEQKVRHKPNKRGRTA